MNKQVIKGLVVGLSLSVLLTGLLLSLLALSAVPAIAATFGLIMIIALTDELL